MKLMLLSETSEAEPYLASAEWACQEKLDGERLIVEWDGSMTTFRNRRGATKDVTGVPRAYSCLPFVIDGELLDTGFVAFDLLSLNGDDMTSDPQWARFSRLQKHSPFRVVTSATGPTFKRALLEAIRLQGGEGVVFKRLSAKYQDGRSPDAVKCKFWMSETFVVGSWTSNGSIGLLKNGEDCGKVRCDLFNGVPKLGSLVEVRFSSWTDNGKLRHPVVLGARADIDPVTV